MLSTWRSKYLKDHPLHSSAWNSKCLQCQPEDKSLDVAWRKSDLSLYKCAIKVLPFITVHLSCYKHWKVNEHCGLNFGPWWHRECDTNINGQNLGPDSNGMGVINKYSLHWHSFGEDLESLKSVKMVGNNFGLINWMGKWIGEIHLTIKLFLPFKSTLDFPCF